MTMSASNSRRMANASMGYAASELASGAAEPIQRSPRSPSPLARPYFIFTQ